MKLATYSDNGLVKIGIVHRDDQSVFDLALAAELEGSPDTAFSSMLSLIDAGPAALDRAKVLLDRRSEDPRFNRSLRNVQLLSPVPEPRQMRDCMLFETHILQAPRGTQRLAARQRGDEAAVAAAQTLPELPPLYRERPIYYLTNRFSVVGHDAVVRWPRYSRVMDFELELGIFLARNGANIPAADAHEYIFGYTIYNDFSARDTQMAEMQGKLGPSKGKSFDSGNAIGPWIVTRDELPDPYALPMSARVNGETWTTNSSAGMLFSFEEVIAFISRDETLHAGEFIGSGTVGNGCGLELDRYLQSGDIVELEIQGIGVLRNYVSAESENDLLHNHQQRK